ncbi:MAG: sulfatase-like hydrolase/transferase [Candidatus Hodarchaeota archaeon]
MNKNEISKYNVIIILADSARYYSTGGKDDRDKLEMMNKFAEESIYFTTAVSTAPSSIMSVSSMLTSLSSYYIASNYVDFIFDEKKYNSITGILKSKGYEVQSIQNARETRERFDTLLPHVPKRFWPKGLKNSEKNWSNKNVNKVLHNYISNRKSDKPLFLFLFYNLRHDPNTSKEVERGISMLKEYIDWDNSIVFLGSDHGYMDPKRGYTPEGLQAIGLGHDLVMSDDNIRIPFYLKYPGFKPDNINEPVSTLDIVPTILFLLGIEQETNHNIEMMGDSLLPLINKKQSALKYFKERKIRTDGRFFAQAARSTSIRDAKYKFVTRPDMNIEEFYDLENDEWEMNNLIDDEHLQTIIDEFRIFYIDSEKKAIIFQIDKIKQRIKAELQFYTPKNNENILIYGFGEPYYCETVIMALKDIYSSVKLILLIDGNQKSNRVFDKSRDNSTIVKYFIENHMYQLDGAKQVITNNIGLAIILGRKNDLGNYKKHYYLLEKIVNPKLRIFLDINTNIGIKNNFSNLIKYLNVRKNYFFKNPDAIFRIMLKIFRRIYKKSKFNNA